MTDAQPALQPRCHLSQWLKCQNLCFVFTQHTPKPPAVVTLVSLEADQHSSQRPEMGHALKHSAGKRTTFSQAQKYVMIEFYNTQAINHMRAEPKNVIKKGKKQAWKLSQTPTSSHGGAATNKRTSKSLPRHKAMFHVTPSASVQNAMQSASVQSAMPSASVQHTTSSASIPHASPVSSAK